MNYDDGLYLCMYAIIELYAYDKMVTSPLKAPVQLQPHSHTGPFQLSVNTLVHESFLVEKYGFEFYYIPDTMHIYYMRIYYIYVYICYSYLS